MLSMAWFVDQPSAKCMARLAAVSHMLHAQTGTYQDCARVVLVPEVVLGQQEADN